jgi:hypothetical protein
MLPPHDPPGQPLIIRWQTRHEALVEDAAGSPIVRLALTPDDEPDITFLVEPSTFEERARLCSALSWAVIEHVRGGQGR